MSTNLVNVYELLQREHGESLAITYEAPPSYLLKVVGVPAAGDKLVFLYEEDRNKLKAYHFVSPTKLNIKKLIEETEDMDLTGSPLKDDCIVEHIEDTSINLKLIETNPWTLQEEFHKGISVVRARSIFCTEEFQIAAAQGSVWFLCNGADAERTLLLQYEFVGDYFSRGTVNFMGVVPAFSVNSQTLLENHCNIISTPGTRLNTYVENTYFIKSHIALRCSWSTTASAPSLNELNSCDVTLSQTFHMSDCGPLTLDFKNQLNILMFIRQDILAYKQTKSVDLSKEPVYRCGRGIDMEDLRENINKVMTEISEFVDSDAGSATDCDIEAVVQRARRRQSTDLTDKLWDILKCCSSYKDLKMAFTFLFQCAARCNIVNTPTNKNRLAEIITEVANRRLAIPCLTGSEPLELLLEIGMEKLHKEYKFIFSESKICSENLLRYPSSMDANKEKAKAVPSVRKSLHNAIRTDTTVGSANRKTLLHSNIKGSNKIKSEYSIGFKNSNFDEADSAQRLAKLLQIHCALEHLLMINIHLNLNSIYGDVCEQLLKKPLSIVATIDESLTDSMDISLSPHYVRDHLEGKDPHTRRITMKTRNTFREVKSTFFYSMENVFPPGIADCFQNEDKEITKADNFYYSWLYRKIKDLSDDGKENFNFH